MVSVVVASAAETRAGVTAHCSSRWSAMVLLV
jgi:hypothetical protein